MALEKTKKIVKKYQTPLTIAASAVIVIATHRYIRKVETKMLADTLTFITEKGLGNEFLASTIKI